jgi:CheY-like chemotaxis protein
MAAIPLSPDSRNWSSRLAGTPPPPDDDVIQVIEDEDTDDDDAGRLSHRSWRILIADDDHSVHEATVAALSGQRVHQRELRFLHAYSAAETLSLLGTDETVDLLLLDVVMETPDAGLRAVTEIRERLGRRELKIIIRTGQPGHAPEQEIRREYAIDGYAKKAELTRSLLRDVIAGALGRPTDDKARQ